MSSITWSGDRLVQRVGQSKCELGMVAQEDGSDSAVLWLKDTCGLLGLNGGYFRADEYASMRDAKANAACSPSAFIMHWIWMRSSVVDQVTNELEENWEIIASKSGANAEKKSVCNQVAEYFRKLPLEEIREWGTQIAKGTVVAALVDLVKTFFE